MEISPASKVGMITVLAIIIIGLIITSITGKGRLEGVRYFVTFDRVEGLKVGDAVRLAGVSVGKVSDVKFNSESNKVVVQITVSYPSLSLARNSRFTITTSLLGDHWVEIVPPARPGDPLPANENVAGVPPVTMDVLMNKGEEALTQLETAVSNVNKLMGDPELERNVKETVANLNALSAEMRTAARNASGVLSNLNGRINLITGHVDNLVTGLQGQLHSIGGDFQALAGTMRRIGERNEPDVRTVVLNLKEMAGSMRATMASVQKLATDKGMNDDILQTVAALRRSGEELEGIAADVRGLTSDPQIQTDIKEAIHDARETVGEARQLIKSVQKAVGGFTGGAAGGGKFKLYEFRTEVEYSTTSQQLRPNATLFLLPNFKYSGVLGVDAIGTRNLLNAQVAIGRPSLRARAGVVRSKLGLGFDTLLFERLGLSADVYDNENVKVDFLGRMTVGNGFYIMGGVREAFRRTSSPVVGVGKRF